MRVLRGCVAGTLLLAAMVSPLSAQPAGMRLEGPPGCFMTCQGTQLMLQGQPMGHLGLNKPDLPAYYRAGRHQERLAAGDLLGGLRRRGFRVLRVELAPPGPAELEQMLMDDPQPLQAYLKGLDDMLADCEDHGMLLVCSLMPLEHWADLGHHSLGEAMRNPHSPGRLKGEQFIREIVTRYNRRTIIIAWEIGPEYNLAADLQSPQGPLASCEDDPQWQRQHVRPVVRDGRNNFTSDELAEFIAQEARLIRSIDVHHLISAGHAAPRREAMHLLRACREAKPPQWHDDSLDEQVRYLQLINPDPVDIISVCHFEMTPTRLVLLKSAGDQLGKPLVVSRAGLCEPWIKPPCYDNLQAVELVRSQMPVLRELGIPLTLYWKYADLSAGQPPDGQPPDGRAQDPAAVQLPEHCLQAGATDEVLDLMSQFNQPSPSAAQARQ